MSDILQDLKEELHHREQGGMEIAQLPQIIGEIESLRAEVQALKLKLLTSPTLDEMRELESENKKLKEELRAADAVIDFYIQDDDGNGDTSLDLAHAHRLAYPKKGGGDE